MVAHRATMLASADSRHAEEVSSIARTPRPFAPGVDRFLRKLSRYFVNRFYYFNKKFAHSVDLGNNYFF